MPENHARLSASGSARWLACPRSVALEESIKEAPSSYAEEGTQAHNLAEKKLKAWRDDMVFTAKLCPPDMDDYTDAYRDYCIQVMKSMKGHTEMLIEKTLDFGQYVPHGFGTGDCCIVGAEEAHVIDFKYGMGVRVEAEGNSQLRLYALGLIEGYWWAYGFKTVTLHIFQPRIGNIQSFTYSVWDLIDWGNSVVKPQARKAWENTGEFNSGPHCRFCKAQGSCVHLFREAVQELAGLEANAERLTPQELSEALNMAEQWGSWAKAVQAYAQEEAVKGVEIPGYKIVQGRSVRTIIKPEELAKALTGQGFSDIYKLKTITELEKLTGKKAFQELAGDCVVKPAGKPTLVPVSDKRPEWTINDFKEEI